MSRPGRPAGAQAPGRLWATVAALAAVTIWGAWFPVTRLGVLAGDITPMDMTVLRFSVGVVVLGPLVLRRGLKAGRAGWAGALAFALTQSGPFALFVALGVVHAPAAHAAIFIPGVFPAIVFLLGLLFLGDRATLRRWLGLASVSGGALLVAVATLASGETGALTGYLFFHACAWMWAVYILTVRVSGLSAAHALGLTHAIGLLVYGPIWLIYGDTGLFDLSAAQLVFQVGYHGLMNGLVAMFLYNYAIERLGATEAAVYAALVPCVAALSAWPILGEAIGWPEAFALAAVVAGVVLINGGRRQPAG